MASTHRMFHFPPLFTLQVNAQTRRKQLDTWREILLAYCSANKVLSVDTATCPVFRNDRINRALSPDAVQVVLDDLVSTGKVSQ